MRIILVGCGIVGQSFLKLITYREAELFSSYGFRPKIVAIVDRKGAAINPKGLDPVKMLSLKTDRGTVAASVDFGRPALKALDVIESVEAEIVIEITPSSIDDAELGLSHIKAAFRNRKHVVTTNKGPLGNCLPMLTELAEQNGVCFRFSGTVGGGTPILEFGKNGLLGDRITAIRGILNGTTNYILSEMDERRAAFHEALRQAQKLGYAEHDPSMDIDGKDTACKLVIMANWIMDKKVTLKDVSIQGIGSITLQDLEAAARKSCTVKLIGSIENSLSVKPTEIDRNDLLCVSGVSNAVTFVSLSAGEETIIGRGAGGMETASAILRDLIHIKRSLANRQLF